jgi:hypothetical protein
MQIRQRETTHEICCLAAKLLLSSYKYQRSLREGVLASAMRTRQPPKVKRFMSDFCKRRGADDFFIMVHLPAVSVFTFYLFWVKAPLSQHRPALNAAKWKYRFLIKINDLTILFCIFVIHFTKGTFFNYYLYT